MRKVWGEVVCGIDVEKIMRDPCVRAVAPCRWINGARATHLDSSQSAAGQLEHPPNIKTTPPPQC